MSNTKKAVYVIVAVVILAAVGYVAYDHFHHSSTGTSTVIQKTPATPPVTYAADGKVVDTFPQALVMGTGPATQSSYKVTYGNTAQSTAIYNTPSSVDSLYQQYLAYLKANNYTLSNNHESASKDQATIFAVSQSASVSVQIAAAQGGLAGQSHVNLVYFKR